MRNLIEAGPLVLFPAVVLVVGVIRSWQGTLSRQRYISWGLGISAGLLVLPLWLARLLGKLGRPNPDQYPAAGRGDPGPWSDLLFHCWTNALGGVLVVVAVALLDRMAQDT